MSAREGEGEAQANEVNQKVSRQPSVEAQVTAVLCSSRPEAKCSQECARASEHQKVHDKSSASDAGPAGRRRQMQTSRASARSEGNAGGQPRARETVSQTYYRGMLVETPPRPGTRSGRELMVEAGTVDELATGTRRQEPITIKSRNCRFSVLEGEVEA